MSKAPAIVRGLMFREGDMPQVGDNLVVRKRFELQNGDLLPLGARYQVFFVGEAFFNMRHTGWDTGSHSLLRRKRRMRI